MKIKSTLCTLALFLATHAWGMQRQEMRNWCWAASTQDVLAQVGIRVSQSQVAARLLGSVYDRPAHVAEVAALLNSYGLKAWVVGIPASPAELRQTLQSGWRIVALAQPNGPGVGHFIVLQAADNLGNVTLSDPATGMDSTVPVGVLYRNWRWMGSVVVGNPRPNAYYRQFLNASSLFIDGRDKGNDSDEGEEESQASTVRTTPNSFKRPEWMTD